jgi:caa(3)-type oxidase subunit IV
MSAEAKHEAHAATAGVDHHEAEHLKLYFKIYITLLVLFGISVLGPVIGGLVHSKALVLVTAFGIALVKAYLVCSHFMGLNIEKRYIGYLLTTTVVFMFLFYAGVSPDVMEHHGRNWENVAAKQETLRAQREHALHPEGHGEGVPAEEH